jgi:MurNAc alpha-1-phosphate uridylyltransferase
MKAMILAAGKGTRLGVITENAPKALVEINGKSALQIAVEKCYAEGFDDLIVNVHHFADQVEGEIKRLLQIGFKITVSDERNELLDTGGGLFKARKFFDKSPFLLYNVDVITDLPLAVMYDFHRHHNPLATIGVRQTSCARCFLINSDNILQGWLNKTTKEKIFVKGSDKNNKGGLAEVSFTGVHIIDPVIFNYMREGKYSMTELYLDLAASSEILGFLYDNGYWYDIGTPQSLNEARNHFSRLP